MIIILRRFILFIVLLFVFPVVDSPTTTEQPIIETTVIDPTIVQSITTEDTTVPPTTIEPTTVVVEPYYTEESTTQAIEPENPLPQEDESSEVYDPEIFMEDVDLLARVIYQEAGSCSEYCQYLVGSTALNLADYYGTDLSSIVHNYNIFNVAYMLYNTEPSETSFNVAENLINNGRDYSVMAFRTDYYHNFGQPYTSVDNVYFSTF